MKRLLITVILVLGIGMAFAQDLDAWFEGYFVDDFGDKTDERYIGVGTLGTFSNSAVVNADCGVLIMVADDYVDFRLFEYGFGNPKVKPLDHETVEIKYRRLGVAETITINPYSLTLWDRNREIIMSDFILSGNDPIRVVLTIGSDYSVDTYKFNIPMKNFVYLKTPGQVIKLEDK